MGTAHGQSAAGLADGTGHGIRTIQCSSTPAGVLASVACGAVRAVLICVTMRIFRKRKSNIEIGSSVFGGHAKCICVYLYLWQPLSRSNRSSFIFSFILLFLHPHILYSWSVNNS